MAEFFKSWEDAGLRIPIGTTTGNTSSVCPQCSHKRKGKNKTQRCVSINLDRKAFKCCNDDCDFFGYITTGEKREYIRPEPLPKIENPISQEWGEFFFKRGISIETLRKVNAQVTEISFPQDIIVEDGKEKWVRSSATAFPYTYMGKLLFYKYRGLNKQFASSKSPQYVPFNIDCVLDEKGKGKAIDTLIWVEGEIDVLTCIECGYPNAISPPNGSNEGRINMEWFDRIVDKIQGIKTHLIATDDDAAGENMRRELTIRLGAENCKNVLFPFKNKKGADKSKDINEVLEAHSKKEVKWCFDNAKDNPILGVKSPKDYKYLLDDVYENGRQPFFKVGFPDLDNLFTWNPGNSLTVVSAKPHSAKSQFVFNIAIRLMFLEDVKWGIFSPETGEIDEIMERLIEIFTGMVIKKENRWKLDRVNRQLYDFAYNFIADRVEMISSEDMDKFELDDYLDIAQTLVRKKGLKGFILDPYNDLDNAFGSENEAIADALNTRLKKAKSFCKRNNAHLVIVPHPSSMSGIAKMEDPYKINGGAAWVNKPDNIVLLNRIEGTGNAYYNEGDNIEITVYKFKKAYAGTRGECTLAYHVPTGRFGNISKAGVANFENYNDFERMIETKMNPELDLPRPTIYEWFGKEEELDVEQGIYVPIEQSNVITIPSKNNEEEEVPF